MKRVYSNSYDVIHLFANLADEERFTRDARCSNVFFENGTLYSYGTHFILAKYVQTKRHGLVVLLNTDTYSVTTSSHQSGTRGALRHHKCIPVPGGNADPHSVFEGFKRDAQPIASKLINARKPEIYIAQLNGLLENARLYANAFGVKIPKNLLSLLTAENGSQYVDALKQERERAVKAQRANLIKALKQWRNFEPVTVAVRCPDGYSYLRYNPELRRIETSQHVELPLTYARQFWQMVEYGRRCEDFQTLIGFRVLDRFTVRAFNSKVIEIGCHRIPLSEVDAIAKQLNWSMPKTPLLTRLSAQLTPAFA